ncbi:putative Na+/H+ antiporter [Bordetella genomosp. 9]|uniref:Na+/H+ antiporter n=1 Tax=Bordetella genomosp. 9 TaxID=1416803 RepID=A0A1W6YVS8_9BORD|nr:putative Na+/H+ antiporter [Bordetella genomosp. 9]ARP85094.1 hypothetical protein CAL13_01825 [Bordetella genomosp. 9]
MNQAVGFIGAAIFALALLHTVFAHRVDALGTRYPRHAGLFHLLGEVEVVFAVWALILAIAMTALIGPAPTIAYLESRQFVEPLFVFAIMVIAASRPILDGVSGLVFALARLLPVRRETAVVWLSLTAIPLLGSFITEPAAMTLAAMILRDRLFTTDVGARWKYLALGVLFVNISIGGTLTAYAAPPVLMVAAAWGWDSWFMLTQFGWKAAIAVMINATALSWLIGPRLSTARRETSAGAADRVPFAVTLIHLGFLCLVVATAHHPAVFLSLLLFFLGFVHAYRRYQSPLILKESLLVTVFLGGLVVLGGLQQWWLQPLVASMNSLGLYAGALGLTAVMDNAAITYLGSLIVGIEDPAKYMLVAGAVAGGGLTVIANAPNPAGVAIVRAGFDNGAVRLGQLLLAALPPTAVATGAFLAL